MKIGITLQSNKLEHIWNTLRFSITSLKASHEVTTFLILRRNSPQLAAGMKGANYTAFAA